MFTNKKNNAKMAWDYGRDPVCSCQLVTRIHCKTSIKPKLQLQKELNVHLDGFDQIDNI